MQEPLLRTFVHMHFVLPVLIACISANTSTSSSDQKYAAVFGGNDGVAVVPPSYLSQQVEVSSPHTASAKQQTMQHIHKPIQLASEVLGLHEKAVEEIRAAQKEVDHMQPSDLPEIVQACMGEQWAHAADDAVLCAVLDYVALSSRNFLIVSGGTLQETALPTGPQSKPSLNIVTATSQHSAPLSPSSPVAVQGNDQEGDGPQASYVRFTTIIMSQTSNNAVDCSLFCKLYVSMYCRTLFCSSELPNVL